MSVDPYQVRTSFGVPILPEKDEAKKPARPKMTYAQAVVLEARRARIRDQPNMHDGNSVNAKKRHDEWSAVLITAFGDQAFTSQDAATAWAIAYMTADNRLYNMRSKGRVIREEKGERNKAVAKWRVVA